MQIDDIDLASQAFWERPLADRSAAFDRLRLDDPYRYYDLPPEITEQFPQKGFHALCRHADVAEASRRPEDFCSGQGGTTALNLPNEEMTRYFGSMISMDDPRHKRLRSIVSSGFTPRRVKELDEAVDRVAGEVVGDLLTTGPCDFVTEAAARLPLRIICEMMGIPEEHWQMVFDQSNTILGAQDDEYRDENLDLGSQLFLAAFQLTEMMNGLIAERVESPTDDLTYGSYLKVPELLSLQQCRSVDPGTGAPEHDETLFIVIHQVYELWFKQLLHELDSIVALLDDDEVDAARHRLKRVLKVLKTLVGQVDVLETMTPAEFANFRSFLAAASGFQSAQFRELEFLLGTKDRVVLDWFEGDEGDRLRRRHETPTLWDAYLRLMSRAGFTVPARALERDVRATVGEDPDVQAAIIDSYADPRFAGLGETLTDLDEGLQEWRYRHVMMVRRTIGTKPGTGGSDGAAYLTTTLFRPAFPDLWAIRTAF